MAQKKGIIARMIEGSEKSEEYARSTLPTNRWQLFWDIFKGNFGKLVTVNLLTLLFFVPMIAVIVFYLMVCESNKAIYPFGTNLGIGYPAIPDQPGLAEYLAVQDGLILYGGVFLTSFIAAIGLAGGMYVIRNMVWTEGVFVSNDFWKGIKLNYKNALQTSLLLTGTLLLVGMTLRVSELLIALEGTSGIDLVFLRISQGTSYFLLAVIVMMSLWMIALGVTYKFTFFNLVRNAFILTFAAFPQTVFFAVLALLPAVFFIIGGAFLQLTGVVVLMLFGVSYALLVWLDFAQWLFDKHVNPITKGAKVGRGIHNKNGDSMLEEDENASEAAAEYQRALVEHGRSRLVARPIKPIDDDLQVYELPESFSREDLKRLRENKQYLRDDAVAYAEEHKNDKKYVEYNKIFDERERALQIHEEGKGKKKKRKPPKMLGE